MFVKRTHIIICLAVLCIGWQGCSSRALHEAQIVIAQADSMRAEGRTYSDSAELAQAYRTLHRRRAFCPDEYAHCCYHYGRLLRAHDDPVAAIQVFINATHSRTRDYAILGRVYSNFGDICHLAKEYPLAYDMYEQSGKMFLMNRDTTAYHYSLYSIAFLLAQQGKKEETLFLLSKFESQSINENMRARILETKAELYLHTHNFDSTIYYAQKVSSISNVPNISNIQIAQAYSYLEEKDSAAYYARNIIACTDYVDNLSALNNALYILTNDDNTKNITSIRETAAERSDIQKLIEIRQGKLSQAVQLLQQDLTRKPNLAWLYTLIATLAIVGVGIIIYVSNKRKKHGLLSQKVEELQQAASAIQEKHDELQELYSTNHQHIEEEINNRCAMLQGNEKIKNTLAWKNYDKMCTIVDKKFYLLASKLRSKQCLNETEVRLCILTLLNCGYDQMAELLYHSTTSIGTLKMRVAKKLGTTSKQLRQYLVDNVCIK